MIYFPGKSGKNILFVKNIYRDELLNAEWYNVNEFITYQHVINNQDYQ